MTDLYLTPAEKYTAALGGFYYGDLPEPGTVYTQLIKDILDGSTPDKVPKNILARFIYSLYISDLGDPYPRYELAKLLYWKLHDITPTKSGSVLTVTIDGKEDYMTINTDLSRLWYKVLFGSKTDVVTEFPYIFNTMQNKLSDWELFGNTVQSGTPTPDSPVMPQGTGERTGNLVDRTTCAENKLLVWASGELYNENGSIATDFIRVKSGDKFVSNYNSQKMFYNKNKVYLGALLNDGTLEINVTDNINTGAYFTVPNVEDITYVRLGYRKPYNAGSDMLTANIMLNTGSTALPYEPFGVKIPISSVNTTTPVYLGEVETTRKIKKLVFDGTENWGKDANLDNLDDYFYTDGSPGLSRSITPISSHFISGKRDVVNSVWVGGTASNPRIVLEISKLYTGITSADDKATRIVKFKSYLAAQYAAGTPVTVWYVLAEPTTDIVNEPLMKIGDYADSMSRSQTGIDIPTVIGQNTLDVLTTIKPSSMSIEYTSADENRSRSKRISLLKSPLKKGLIK